MLRYVLEPGALQRPVPAKPSGGDSSAGSRDSEAVLESLRATTIGAAKEVQTPFGSRRTVYADYTASGRGSSIVEDFVRDKVLPCYGNTHTLTTATARQTTYLRAEAREVIRHNLNATHEDAVIFAGNGSTGAAHLFVQTLQRAGFHVGRAGSQEGVRDMYYREDRWGGGECTLCGLRVKSAAIYQAHQHSEAHRARVRAAAEGHAQVAQTGRGAEALPPRRRRVVVLADAVLHHSSSLPFRELVPQHPLQGPPALPDFTGGSWQAAEDSSNSLSVQSAAQALGLEVELSTIPIDCQTGLVDEAELKRRLEALRAWRDGGGATIEDTEGDAAAGAMQNYELVVFCVLAAASNVTGLCVEVPRVTSLIRGVLSDAVVCWDYAAAYGHGSCNLNPPTDPAAMVDAAFFSPHKLWGGPGSVGVLAVKKRLLCNAVPAAPGGGVVFYVSDAGHSYIQNSEEREEAGTPNIIGCIRAGLVFHVLDQLPEGAVVAREQKMLQRVMSAFADHQNIEVLGPTFSEGSAVPARTGIVSFMIRYGNSKPGLYLHYNFVAALLNDLFGVQARGGCACAGPYAQWLLGISADLSVEMEQCLKRTAQEVLRPGFVRVGVHWAMSEEDVEVLVAAVKWVATYGWRLLAAYTFDRETGEWLHRLDAPERRRVWLSNIKLADAASPQPIAEFETALGIAPGSSPTCAPRGKDALLAAADLALKEAYSSAQVALSQSKWPVLNADYAHLLWFALPADVAHSLRSAQPERPQIISGESVFASDKASARPEHSILDARKIHAANGRADESNSASGDALGNSVEWDPLEAMVPEDGEDDEEAAQAQQPKGPSFTRSQLRPSIPKPLRGLVGKAIADFNMINEGDRLLVGLSGGKDSLTVLHILLALKRSAPINFEVAAATVDPETPEFNPWPLQEYLKAIGVEYHMLSKPIIEMAKTHMDPKRPSLCAFCSRMKRGLLYSCMREKGYNVLVLGQHLDDFAESFFMSAIHNGLLRTMKANYWVQQEDVRVCRPLLYVRESATAMFAKENQLPIIADNCPACFAAPKERHKTKVLLSSLEFDYPQLFSTLLRTMKPLYALETADRADGILAGEGGVGDEDGGDAQATAADGGSGQAKRGKQSNGAASEGGRRVVRVAPPARDAADEDAAAELVLSACGPSAAGDVAVVCSADGACYGGTPDTAASSTAREDQPAFEERLAAAGQRRRSSARAAPLSGFATGFAAGLASAALLASVTVLAAGRRGSPAR